MYDKIFTDKKLGICWKLNPKTVLLYIAMIHFSDAFGIVKGDSSLSVRSGIRSADFNNHVEELIEENLIEHFTEPHIIAEIGNHKLYGELDCYKILNYEIPSRIERLNATQWAQLRQSIFIRDDFTCIYCHTRGGSLECDHIIPISNGGTNEPGNLVTACKKCNRDKRDKIITILSSGDI